LFGQNQGRKGLESERDERGIRFETAGWGWNKKARLRGQIPKEENKEKRKKAGKKRYSQPHQKPQKRKGRSPGNRKTEIGGELLKQAREKRGKEYEYRTELIRKKEYKREKALKKGQAAEKNQREDGLLCYSKRELKEINSEAGNPQRK